MNINYNTLFKMVIPYFIIILVAYIATTTIYFLLPSKAPQYTIQNGNNLEYHRFNILDVFKKIKSEKKEIVQKKKKNEYSLLTNIELVAIYALGKGDGYIIIKEKNQDKTELLSIKDSFKGYVLREIFNTYALFSKDKQEYKLQMNIKKNDLTYEVVKEDETITTTKSISVENGIVKIKRDLVDGYIKNSSEVWKNISIKDERDNGKLKGFRVSKIKRGTPFAKIGLKEGDLIIRINNIEIRGYNDVLKIYKNINKIDALNIVVLRNNEEVEIYYEIK